MILRCVHIAVMTVIIKRTLDLAQFFLYHSAKQCRTYIAKDFYIVFGQIMQHKVMPPNVIITLFPNNASQSYVLQNIKKLMPKMRNRDAFCYGL